MSEQNTQKEELPSSVSKYSGYQLAYAFVKIMKDPRINKIIIPTNIQLLRPDIRKMLTWKIDYRYGNVTGLGDMNRAITRIMLYATSVPPTKNKPPQTNTSGEYDSMITELEKQRQELNNKINN